MGLLDFCAVRGQPGKDFRYVEDVAKREIIGIVQQGKEWQKNPAVEVTAGSVVMRIRER